MCLFIVFVSRTEFLSFAEEGNSSCRRNVQHNILASVNFLNIFLSKLLHQGADRANYQAQRVLENADCNTIFCFTISLVCCCCILTVVYRLIYFVEWEF